MDGALLIEALDIEDDAAVSVEVALGGVELLASLRKTPRGHRQRARSYMTFHVADCEGEGHLDLDLD